FRNESSSLRSLEFNTLSRPLFFSHELSHDAALKHMDFRFALRIDLDAELGAQIHDFRRRSADREPDCLPRYRGDEFAATQKTTVCRANLELGRTRNNNLGPLSELQFCQARTNLQHLSGIIEC